jgi:hypothetical protein
MSPPSTTLSARAEAALRRLRDVEQVSVLTEHDEIREIHILTGSVRPPKQIVRDVQTALRTALGVAIDHRVVSIALTNREPAPAAAPVEPAPRAYVEPLPGAAPAPRAYVEPLPGAAPAPRTPPPAVPAAERDDRVRFEGVNLYVSGPRTQAQVELRWRGLPRMGSASGLSTRDESHRLVAQATATAVQDFLTDPVAFTVQDVEFVEVGRRRVAVVAIAMLAHRQEKMLTGACTVEQDTPQAVVLATLAALNRVLGGMQVKEPTEYVLRSESLTRDS